MTTASERRKQRRTQQAAASRSKVAADDVIDTTGTESVSPKRKVRRTKVDPQQKALEAAKRDTERINDAVSHTHLLTDIPGFPRNERPWSLANGEGKAALAENAPTDHSLSGGTVVVEMDAGAFRWLWEGCEVKALDNYRRYHGVMDDVSDAGLRALTAMRKAGHHNWKSKYPHLNEQSKRKVVRRSTNKSTETETKKRVIRRKK